MKYLMFYVLCFIFKNVYSQEESCETPNLEPGECIGLNSCPELLDKLKQNPLTSHNSKIANYLRKAICGFEGPNPKICCALRGGKNYFPAVKPTTTAEPVTIRKTIGPISSSLLPSTEECGTGSDYRLVGAVATELDEFPWMCLIEYQKSNGRGFHCGCVLISKRYVLTAAHCVKGKDIPKNWKLISVRLGEYDTETDPDCDKSYCADKSVNVVVTEQITHERYDPNDSSYHHDIALLRLVRDVPFTDYIKPICIPTSVDMLNKNFANINMTVSGWGITETRSASTVKLKLQVPVKSHSQCISVYGPARVNFVTSQICAGGIKGQDSCKGDSGGPLMTFHQTSTFANWFVAGIVSFGPLSCGLEDWPSIYTRVTEYVPWIVSKLKP